MSQVFYFSAFISIVMDYYAMGFHIRKQITLEQKLSKNLLGKFLYPGQWGYRVTTICSAFRNYF